MPRISASLPGQKQTAVTETWGVEQPKALLFYSSFLFKKIFFEYSFYNVWTSAVQLSPLTDRRGGGI